MDAPRPNPPIVAIGTVRLLVAARARVSLISSNPAVANDPLVVVSHVEEPGGRVEISLRETGPESTVRQREVTGRARTRRRALDAKAGRRVALEALPHAREMVSVCDFRPLHALVTRQAAHALPNVGPVREM